MLFWRVAMLRAIVCGFVLVLTPAAFLSALFLHARSLGAAGVFLLAVGMASEAVFEAFLLRWVFHLGRWTGWNKKPIWRSEQPVRYWTCTALHAAIFGAYAASAVILTAPGLGLTAR